MASTYIPADNTGGGFTIVTHVIPAPPPSAGAGLYESVPGPGAALHGNLGNGGSSPFPVESFLKRQPNILGAIQITAAVVTLLLGIVLTLDADTISVHSLIMYWGSIIYISAGCLSIVATKKPHPYVMKGLLGSNVASIITAGAAVVLLSLDLVYGLGNVCFDQIDICNMFKKQTNGINGVLLVFFLLQFITSICMTLFVCDVTCSAHPLVPVGPGSSDGACCSLLNPVPAHSNHEGVFVISNSSLNTYMNIPTLAHPPEYSETELHFQPAQTSSGPAASRTE